MSVFHPKKDHILSLSDEVVVHILSFLSSGVDIVNVALSCTKLARLARDKRVIRRLSFRRDIRLTHSSYKSFLSVPSTCDKIKQLNLNGVYWIQPSLLHPQLIKMKNLTDLHVGDVLFTAKQFSALLSKLTLLTKLSFTWSWCSSGDIKEILKSEHIPVFQKLTHLTMYLAIGDRYPLEGVNHMLSECHHLEHLAIFTEIVGDNPANLSTDRYNVVVNMRRLSFPRIKQLVVDLQNFTLPDLLVSSFLANIRYQDRKSFISEWNVPCHNGDLFPQFQNSENLTLLLDGLRDMDDTDFFSLDKYGKDYIRTDYYTIINEDKLYNVLMYAADEEDLDDLEEDGENCIPCGSCQDILNGPHVFEIGNCALFALNNCVLKKFQELNIHLRDVDFMKECHDVKMRTFKTKLSNPNCFENLVKLSIPICGYLDHSTETDEKHSNQQQQPVIDADGFAQMLDHMRSLKHVEVKPCPKMELNSKGAKVVEALIKAPQLTKLVISNVGIQINPSDSLFPKLFSSCSQNTELHISEVHSDPQKLFTSIEKGLKFAKNMKILKIYQKQFTQYSERVLSAISEHCQKIEQILIMDPSKSFTLKKFPLKVVSELASYSENLGFLCLGTELLTNEDIKVLKSHVKKVKQEKPYLVGMFMNKIGQSWSGDINVDTKSLPMEYQRNYATLKCRNKEKYSTSEVATCHINKYF